MTTRQLPTAVDRALAAELVPVRPDPPGPRHAPVTEAEAARHLAELLAACAPARPTRKAAS
jgi:hypothetical protein